MKRPGRSRRRLSRLPMLAVVVAGVVAYIAALVFIVELRPSRESPPQDRVPAAAPSFPSSDYRQDRFPRLDRRRLLIGVNYTHDAFRHCSLNGTGILRSYNEPGVAKRVHNQLFRMRRAGIATIATVVWHMTDATNQIWGPIPSAGGRLHEPYRTNLIRFVGEIRKFGFARLTIKMAPKGANDPRLPGYKRSKLKENWRFIKSVRSVVKRYGPADTRIDLAVEGAPSEAPSEYYPVPEQSSRYVRTLYGLYVKRFGNRDVQLSVIAPTHIGDKTNRLQKLINALKSTRQPMPRRYVVHIPYDRARASYALRNVDEVLRRNGQPQPLVIGETAYDNRGVAAAIRHFLTRSSRRIEEVSPWYLRRPRGCNTPPPYSPGPYGRALGHAVGVRPVSAPARH